MAPMRPWRHVNVLVVCHGNVCRSPLAHRVIARSLGDTYVQSAGVKTTAGRPAAKKVREYAALHGYDLATHRSTPLTLTLYQWADVLLYMDGGNLKRLKGSGLYGEKCMCLAQYGGTDRIPDPGYLPRGQLLTDILNLVVECANAFVKEFKR